MWRRSSAGSSWRRSMPSVDQHRAAGGPVQAEDELFQRRLARADAPQNGHALAGFEAKTDVAQRGVALARVVERDVFELDRAFNPAAGDEAGAIRALHFALHHVFERGEGGGRSVVLHQHTGHLADGRQGARSEHRAGDEPAHGEFARTDQIDPQDDDGDRDRPLHKGRRVAGTGREQPQLRPNPRQQGGALFPFALDRGFGGQCFEGLETDQALDQGGVALRTGAVGGFGERVHAPLTASA